MRIGYGFGDDQGRDEAVLRNYKCDHLLLTTRRAGRPHIGAMRAIRLLNRKDSLVIVHLNRLGDTSEIVWVANELWKRGILLEVIDERFGAHANGAEQFLKGAASLCELFALTPPKEQEIRLPARRGRPPIITKQQMARAHRCLNEGMSVAQTAKLLQVSTSTLYRRLPNSSTRTDGQ